MMFENNNNNNSDKNDKAIHEDKLKEVVESKSHSDQVIIVRSFAQKIPYEICGIKMNVQAPSFVVSQIIELYKSRYRQAIISPFTNFQEALQKLDRENRDLIRETFSGKHDDVEKTTKNIELIARLNDSVKIEDFKHREFSDKYTYRLAQLIILNNVNRDWIDDHETYEMPSQEVLDSAIELKTLYKKANPQEINGLIELHNELDKPKEYRKKNLVLMGYPELAGETKTKEKNEESEGDFPGRGSGQTSQNTTQEDSENRSGS